LFQIHEVVSIYRPLPNLQTSVCKTAKETEPVFLNLWRNI